MVEQSNPNSSDSAPHRQNHGNEQRRRWFLYVLFGILVFGLGFWGLLTAFPDVALLLPEFDSAGADAAPIRRMTGEQGPSKLAPLRKELKRAYRIRPDGRLMQAVAEVHRLLMGEADQEVSTEFRDNSWQVRYGEQDVGSLSELPDFPDLLQFLVDWSKRIATDDLPAGDDIPERTIGSNGFTGEEALTVLESTNRLWNNGPRDVELFERAAQSLIVLSFQNLDLTEVADLIPSRALASLAIYKSFVPEGMVHEECLLAHSMDYRIHAGKLVERLDETDPLRLYVHQEDERLHDLAAGEEGSIFARYLYLKRLSEQKDTDAWAAWSSTYFDEDESMTLPVLMTGLALKNFETNIPMGEALVSEILGDVSVRNGLAAGRESSDLAKGLLGALFGDENSHRVPQLESALAKRKVEAKGPLLDRELLEAYSRGPFYSALFLMGIHYLDKLGSNPAALDFAQGLGESEDGPGADFPHWYHHLARVLDRQVPASELESDLQELESINGLPLKRTFDELSENASVGAPDVLRASRILFRRFDSRPLHRYNLARVAQWDLLDLVLAEKLYASTVECHGFTSVSMKGWYAGYSGDKQTMREMLIDPDFEPQAASRILVKLQKEEDADEQWIVESYEHLVVRDPDDWKIVDRFFKFLLDNKRYAKAREVVSNWLARNDESAGFPYIFARINLCVSYYYQKRYEEALQAIQPVTNSWQLSALTWTAWPLERLGRHEEAWQFAQAVHQRYPDTMGGLIMPVNLCWNRREHKEAAKLLSKTPFSPTTSKWGYGVSPSFLRRFEDDYEEGSKAVTAMLEEGIDPVGVFRIGTFVAKEGHHQLAFEIMNKVQDLVSFDAQVVMQSYRSLKEWKGNEAAGEWLQEKLTDLHDASFVFYHYEEYDLLWNFISDETADESAWLLRATSLPYLEPENHSYRETLQRHYQEEGSGLYHVLGRYMLGLATEEDAIEAAKTDETACKVAYFIGAKAQAQKDYPKAADWYHTALETGISHNIGYKWAFRQLYRWRGKAKSIKLLAAD